MISTICKCCKYQVYCTFPSTGRVRECDEFEDVENAAAFEWNLQDLLKFWPPAGEEKASTA